MSDTKISALPAASTPLTGSEVVPLNQSGVTSNVTVANLTAGRNVFANNFIPSVTTTTASSTPINLTVNSTQYQTVNGTTTSQQFNLPDATTLSVGDTYYFNNNLTVSSVQVNAHDGSTSILSLQAGGDAQVILLNNSTTNGTWDVHSFIPSSASWGTATLSFNNTTSISGSVSWTGTKIGTAYGGTGLSGSTPFTANGIVYASSTSALATSSNLTWDGTTFSVAGPIQASAGHYSSIYSSNSDGGYPSNYLNSAGGDSQVSIAANWFSGQKDLSIVNSNIAGGGFGFYQMTSSSAKTRLISFNTGTFQPGVDNTMTLGASSFRWTTVYATTALINTSDQNDKQQIADLTSAEQTVAKALKGLFKTYKLNSAVALKGDKARIHVGIMAQDVYQTFVNQGLDPTKYALFCSDTWQEYNGHAVSVDSNNMYDLLTGYTLNGQTVTLNDGDVVPEGATQIYTKVATTTVTKLGIRYAELMAFIISAL